MLLRWAKPRTRGKDNLCKRFVFHVHMPTYLSSKSQPWQKKIITVEMSSKSQKKCTSKSIIRFYGIKVSNPRQSYVSWPVAPSSQKTQAVHLVHVWLTFSIDEVHPTVRIIEWRLAGYFELFDSISRNLVIFFVQFWVARWCFFFFIWIWRYNSHRFENC